MFVSLLALAISTSPAQADEPDIAPALEQPKKAKWDPKGKAMDAYLQARIQMKKEDWAKATELYVDSLDKQAGCGKCLNELGDVLIGAERYDAAAETGKLLAELYPDKVHGWANVANAMRKKRDWQASIDALDKVIAIDADAGWAWNDRTDSYIQLGKTDDALEMLDGGTDAGIAAEDIACNRVLVYTARDDVDSAREQWETCTDSKSADLRRSAEGWLALTEGDAEKAAKSLMRAGTGDAIRLALAMARYEEGKLDASVNLIDKLLADLDWSPWDAHVVRAQALIGLDRGDEALEQLQAAILADGWVEAHPDAGAPQVLLKAKGKGWAKELGLTAAELAVSVLAAKGDREAAQALYDQAVTVYGETEGLKNALPAEEAPADE
jgi:tetratricopeptide (TPR) repeat protein